MSFYMLKYHLQTKFFPLVLATVWMTGSTLATMISFAKHGSIELALGHGLASWLYVAYDVGVQKGIITF